MKSLSFLLCSQEFDIVIDTFDDPKNLTNNWQFALLDLAGSHYAAICTEKDRTAGGESDFLIAVVK
jgi:4'-phosphopantetheinyl transferase